MILILMEGAERTWVDVALAAHGVELKPSGSGVWVLSEFETERQPQLIRAVFGCRTIMDMVAFSVLPFLWHLTLFVLGALGISALVSPTKTPQYCNVDKTLPKATTKETLNFSLRKLGKKS